MYYVYLLQSVSCKQETYVGVTEDIDASIAAHNIGKNSETRQYRPWVLVVCAQFAKINDARLSERALREYAQEEASEAS
jgi:predicted GIY-YIG superfamily endonuclease